VNIERGALAAAAEGADITAGIADLIRKFLEHISVHIKGLKYDCACGICPAFSLCPPALPSACGKETEKKHQGKSGKKINAVCIQLPASADCLILIHGIPSLSIEYGRG
jgi:hypothetical protein